MKKLLLLSVFCLGFIAQANDDSYPLNTKKDLNNFENILKNYTKEDIKKDFDAIVDPQTKQLIPFDEAIASNLKSRKIGVTCWGILNSLDSGFPFNTDAGQEQLKRFIEPCSLFSSNVSEVANNHSSLDREFKEGISRESKELINKANELKQKLN